MLPFSLSPELQDGILRLASQSDIKSISCPFDEFYLWKSLLQEQVKRTNASGLPPQEVFFLSGPDSGIPGITPPRYLFDDLAPSDSQLFPVADSRTGGLAPHRWGGDVHIPYEGACGADLFIIPKWHNVLPEGSTNSDTKLSYLLGGKKCNYLLTNRMLGELPCATWENLAGWNLYINSRPYDDCHPMRG